MIQKELNWIVKEVVGNGIAALHRGRGPHHILCLVFLMTSACINFLLVRTRFVHKHLWFFPLDVVVSHKSMKAIPFFVSPF